MADERARQLRQDSTDAERAFWYLVRDRRLNGFKFRRQVALGPFIADFVCFEKNLMVEIDGGQHGEDATLVRDARRSAWLAEHGFRVVRFWNNEVLNNRQGVQEVLLQVLTKE